MGGVVCEPVVDLLRTFEAEVRTAEHQDDLDQRRSEGAQDQCERQDQQQLVAERANGDAFDNWQLTLGSEPADIGRGDCGVVDHHASSLRAGACSCCTDVVD